MQINKGLGWRKHTPEEKAKIKVVRFSRICQIVPPDNYDQRSKWPPVYDQGEEGSCTANGAGGVIDFRLKLTHYPWPFTPSRAFIYYNTRLLDGDDTSQDTGGTISGAINAIAQDGVCPEDGNPAWSMPYVSGNYAEVPTPAMYKDALLHVALQHEAVPQDEEAVKALLYQDIPIVFGFQVYSSFMTEAVANSGVMPVPHPNESLQGGHCVVAVGYLSNYAAGSQGITDWIICRNSWGFAWGENGYFLMPLKEVFLNPAMASDFGIITDIGYLTEKISKEKSMGTSVQQIIQDIIEAATALQTFANSPTGQELIAELEAILAKIKATGAKMSLKG